MKHKLFVALGCVCFPAFAAPFIVADPVPATAVQPDAASITINGGTPVACVFETVTGGIRPKCDVGNLAFGTYTIVLTYSKTAGCTNGADTATCTQAGSASAAPFTYVYRAGSVSAPAARRIEP
mgnify:CR=1 FL=1